MDGQLVLPAGSAAAGARLRWQAWLPEGAPRAAVCLSHGYAEHIGRYDGFARALTAKGIAVYGLDHWGHGKSDGSYGFVPRFSVFADGQAALLAEVERRHPDLPRFLVGHSMGGLIAVHHLQTHQSRYAGAVLSGSAILAGQEPSRLMVAFSRFLSRFFPRLGVLALNNDALSRDPAVVTAYQDDPLVYSGKMSARLAAEMFDAMHLARSSASKVTLPILLLHGGSDKLTSKAGSEFLAQHVGSADRTLKIYPGLYHEIFNEPEKEAVIGDVTDWIERHLP